MNRVLRSGTIVFGAILVAGAPVLAGPFPEIPGYTKQDEPRSYDPDSLFEYINGDAFSYINFGFEEVTVQDYESEESPELTIDIKLPHAQKLQRKRQEALARGVLIQDTDDFVPAVIRSDDRSVRVPEGFLDKPVSEEMLVRTIRKIMEVSRKE